MHFIFQEDEKKKNINANRNSFTGMQEQGERALWKTTFYFAIMVGILIFANWVKDESI